MRNDVHQPAAWVSISECERMFMAVERRERATSCRSKDGSIGTMLFYSTWRKPLVRALEAEGVRTWEDLRALSTAALLRHSGVSRVSVEFVALQLHAHQPPALPPPAPAVRSRRSQPTVYFVRCGAFVKIGLTVNIQGRLATARTFVPYPLTLAHLIPCELADMAYLEAVYHEQFRPYHHRGEWFRDEGALATFLQTKGCP